MINKHFDEFQLQKRNKIGYQTMILLVILIMLNGFIKQFYIWAPPFIESIVLVYLAMFYLIIMGIFKNAYFGKNKIPTTHFVLWGVGFGVGLLSILGPVIQSIMYGQPIFQFVKDGMLDYSFLPVLYFLLFGIVFVGIIFKKYSESRVEE